MTFLKKIKNTDPLMDAKFKSKTHLLNFWRRFLRVWLQSLKKVLNMTNIFFIIKKGIKNAVFHADLKSIEKVKKIHQKKLKVKQV